MTKEDLMIGDWVNWSYDEELITPAKVVEIREDEVVILVKGDTAADIVEYQDILPIPLPIAEILEKNGWKYSNGKECYYSADSVIYPHSDKPSTLAIRVGFCQYAFPFSYVHELQHALRICGLTDLADNFKVL